MSALSPYEQKALVNIEQEKQRRLSTSPRRLMPPKVKAVATGAGRRVKDLPGADRAADAAGRGYARAAEGVGKFLSRSSQFTLSSRRVVRAYHRRGFDVEGLEDIRALDLQTIDGVARFKRLANLYAGAVAVEGAGAGLAISGGALLAVGGSAGAGAAAAPGLAVVTGAVAGDAVAVLMAGSRVVAHTALYYGYDPEDPREEVFAMSVINLGAATTQGAKMSAYGELSRLTQLLARSAPWEKLNQSMLTRVAQRFAAKFGQDLTKKKLGQLVPVAGVVVGAGMNYALVDSIAEAAYWSYRERFLRDKLGQAMSVPLQPDAPPDDVESDMQVDEAIDLLGLLEDEGFDTTDPDRP
ncbi:EcsC family protein [Nocardioides bigeumensis]|uniref:EcsC family protein n=1 Tax=Nocardioides bigeumensis TaxID=433657 RepID=A0ABP5JTX4_9ACTN